MKAIYYKTPAFLSIVIAYSYYSFAIGQTADTTQTLKETLLQELKTTQNQKEWFVPLSVALDGVTAGQAVWKEASGNHSVAQLASHLLFWNDRILKQLKNEPVPEFSGNNEESFEEFEEADWQKTLSKLDKLMNDFEKLIEEASDEQIQRWAKTLTHVSTHNAYHIGQIVVIRKLQGSWDPQKGVK